jgi:hypothetical protein
MPEETAEPITEHTPAYPDAIGAQDPMLSMDPLKRAVWPATSTSPEGYGHAV